MARSPVSISFLKLELMYLKVQSFFPFFFVLFEVPKFKLLVYVISLGLCFDVLILFFCFLSIFFFTDIFFCEEVESKRGRYRKDREAELGFGRGSQVSVEGL